jgi:AmiR/NasT family two-component response regulator
MATAVPLSESQRAGSEGLVSALQEENEQLRHALVSRIAIEQAKGVLAERYGLTPDRAFQLLRRAARTNRVKIHLLAAEVIASRTSPLEIVDALAAIAVER